MGHSMKRELRRKQSQSTQRTALVDAEKLVREFVALLKNDYDSEDDSESQVSPADPERAKKVEYVVELLGWAAESTVNDETWVCVM